MIITCDATCDRGFYYVKPPSNRSVHYHEQKVNKLTNYVDKSKVRVYKSVRNDITFKLSKMVLSTKTYKSALEEEEIDAEFFSGLDEYGHLSGIEISLKKERLIYLVENHAFNCFIFYWQRTEYKLHTLDIEEEVFYEENIIYPFSKVKDSFAIVKVVNRETNVAVITGIITLREDIYPTDYMIKPLFILSE